MAECVQLDFCQFFVCGFARDLLSCAVEVHPHALTYPLWIVAEEIIAFVWLALALHKRGFSMREIAFAIDRSVATVFGYIEKNAQANGER